LAPWPPAQASVGVGLALAISNSRRLQCCIGAEPRFKCRMRDLEKSRWRRVSIHLLIHCQSTSLPALLSHIPRPTTRHNLTPSPSRDKRGAREMVALNIATKVVVCVRVLAFSCHHFHVVTPSPNTKKGESHCVRPNSPPTTNTGRPCGFCSGRSC
jgi:hypothetical protein